MSKTFKALRHPNYRLWAAGALVSNIGTWMQRVAQDWLVLTQLTQHDAAAVGVTTGLQFLPIIVLGPYAGVLGDRLDKRKLLMGTQSAMGALGLLQAVLVLSGTAQLWEVYAIALGLGVASAIDAPPRQAFVSELVGRADVPNAVALNSASFNLARLAGPGIAGVLIGLVGTGWVFLLNAVTFAAVLTSLTRLRTDLLQRTPPVPRGKHQIREGIRYVRDQPRILLIMAMAALVGTFTLNFQVTNALMAADVFRTGPDAYGLLGSVMAVGTLAGALLAARRKTARMGLLVAAAVLLGLATIVAAAMPGYVWFALALVPVGLAAITFLNLCNTIVQLSTEAQFRGRVLALYMAVIQGGTPIGAPLVGWIANAAGPRWSVAAGGLAALTAGVLGVVALSRRGEGTFRDQLRAAWATRRTTTATGTVPVAPSPRQHEVRAETTAQPAGPLASDPRVRPAGDCRASRDGSRPRTAVVQRNATGSIPRVVGPRLPGPVESGHKRS
ncbi:MFS transporter [Sinomonas sp. JGH33]|uniref:MFS transporter n=1 Tax=Sinomonas terricola TaxID=3110330 RepID=A0ABU5T8Q3_9MICC|nr:MFS transporter [Sinomonas sp. JGH33]MEA5455894.1 MFS transporter [Sinomonas sp. JGH33]